MAPVWLKAQPFAHRGLHDRQARRVENTLPAVEAAIAEGYGIEVDLQLSADDEVVVFHDMALERLTFGQGPLRAHRFDQLKALELRDTEARIPTLADLLDLVGGRAPLLLELKSENLPLGHLEARVARQLAHYDGEVAVMAFKPSSLAWFAKHKPHITRGQLSRAYREESATFKAWAMRFLRRNLLVSVESQPHFIAYEVTALPGAFAVAVARAAGMPILAWTVRDEEDLLLATKYADNIIFENLRP